MFRVSSMLRPIAMSLITLLCLTVIPGCGSKVTSENYAKIKTGQTEAEVVDILGKPTSTETQGIPGMTGSKETWKDGDKTIMVGFLDGKVAMSEKSGF